MKIIVVHHEGRRCPQFGFGWYVLVIDENDHAGNDLVAVLGPYASRFEADHEADMYLSHNVAE